MKKLNLAAFILLIIVPFLSCSPQLRPTNTTVKHNQLDNSYSYDRLKNVSYLNYISNRTVLIHRDCEPKSNILFFGVNDPSKVIDGYGSGAIVTSYSDKSYIFTAAHVVEQSDDSYKKHFDCRLGVISQHDRNEGITELKEAKILSIDHERDLAVLYVKHDYKVFSDLSLNPITGEDVWASGYPVQLMNSNNIEFSVTKGTLATGWVSSPLKPGKYHRVTSQVYFGNSGGGVWNAEGELVSIVVLLFQIPGGPPFEGYYYTKPVGEILDLLSRDEKIFEVIRNNNRN